MRSAFNSKASLSCEEGRICLVGDVFSFAVGGSSGTGEFVLFLQVSSSHIIRKFSNEIQTHLVLLDSLTTFSSA